MNISCVIPTHNRDDFLLESLQSVLAQTLKPDEIIVVDDRPCLETRRLVDEISKKTNIIIRYIENPSGMGAGDSRNVGVKVASGDFIALLDDDDLWDEQFLSMGMDLIQSSGADFMLCWMKYLEGDRLTDGKSISPELKPEDFVLCNPGITGSNIIISRNAYVGVDGFDKFLTSSNDKDFMIRLLKGGYRYSVLESRLLIHRIHSGERLTRPGVKFCTAKTIFYQKHRDWMTWCLRFSMWTKLISLYVDREFSWPIRIRAYLVAFARRLILGIYRRLSIVFLKRES